MTSGHLEGLVSHKNTQYQKVCVYLNLSVYISRDSAYRLQLKCMVGHFFQASLHRHTLAPMKIQLVLLTCRLSTLTMLSGHLEGLFSHKIIQYQKVCVYFCIYISRDVNSSLTSVIYGPPFFHARSI